MVVSLFRVGGWIAGEGLEATVRNRARRVRLDPARRCSCRAPVYDDYIVDGEQVGANGPVNLGRQPPEILQHVVKRLAVLDGQQGFEDWTFATGVEMADKVLPPHGSPAIWCVVVPAKADFALSLATVVAVRGARRF
jgi:hypothetical protein